MEGLWGVSALKSSPKRMQILHNRTHLEWQFLHFCFDYSLFYTHLESIGLTGDDRSMWINLQWVRAICFFHWLFSMQLKNHSLKKTDKCYLYILNVYMLSFRWSIFT